MRGLSDILDEVELLTKTQCLVVKESNHKVNRVIDNYQLPHDAALQGYATIHAPVLVVTRNIEVFYYDPVSANDLGNTPPDHANAKAQKTSLKKEKTRLKKEKKAKK